MTKKAANDNAKTTTTAHAKTTASALAKIALLSIFLGSSLSCYCWREGNRNTRTCVTVRNIVDCTIPEIKRQVKALSPAMTILMAGGAPELSAISALEALTYAGVVCSVHTIKSEAETEIAKPQPSGPTAGLEAMQKRAKALHLKATFEAWKETHQDIDVKND